MKTAKNYRLNDSTIEQIEWLAGRSPHTTATDVIENVVREKYESERRKIRVRAVKARGDKYNLVADQMVLATINQAVLDATQSHKRQLLAEAGADLNVIGVVFLATALAKNAYVKWNHNPRCLALINPQAE
ncbi:MAG TPA: hypothetical protein VLX61_01445 [Anaerolineales bacterium]|nr:hypothetical protein [Anaerolineales bacterium]